MRHAKPSTRCFELIRGRERCRWDEMAYVGDNPAKDLVNLNPLGVHTVRVRTDEHAAVAARPGHDAQHQLGNLAKLPLIFPEILAGR